jgi:hypothetical protein
MGGGDGRWRWTLGAGLLSMEALIQRAVDYVGPASLLRMNGNPFLYRNGIVGTSWLIDAPQRV